MNKLRELKDIGHLFFITDDTKIKGNKAYEQGNYYEAIEVYEQVLGCYVWLEFTDKTKKDRLFTDFNSKGIVDKDIEFKEKSIVREADREFETETSKFIFILII